jgi:acetyl esterase/lipase
MRRMILGVGALVASLFLAPYGRGEQPDHIIDLWPSGPPGEPMDVGDEIDLTKDSDKLIGGRRIIKLGNVKKPQAHVYLPPLNLRTGASIVICPGGGFSILAWDLEGTEIAQWLASKGVAAIVLKYRVPTRTQNPPWLAPAQDLQRTISLVRSKATDWKLDPNKVGALGFSAGGTTVFRATYANKRLYDKQDAIDDQDIAVNRAIFLYSGGLPENTDESTITNLQLGDKSPPVFMIHTFDDFVPVLGTTNFYHALKKAGVPAELHIFDHGGHGYGMRNDDQAPVTKWPSLCEDWLRRGKWIDP